MSCGPGERGRSGGGVTPGGDIGLLSLEGVRADFGNGTEAVEEGGSVDASVAVDSGGGEMVMVMDDAD